MSTLQPFVAFPQIELGFNYPLPIVSEEEAARRVAHACRVIDACCVDGSMPRHPYRPATDPALAPASAQDGEAGCSGQASGEYGGEYGDGTGGGDSDLDEQVVSNTVVASSMPTQMSGHRRSRPSKRQVGGGAAACCCCRCCCMLVHDCYSASMCSCRSDEPAVLQHCIHWRRRSAAAWQLRTLACNAAACIPLQSHRLTPFLALRCRGNLQVSQAPGRTVPTLSCNVSAALVPDSRMVPGPPHAGSEFEATSGPSAGSSAAAQERLPSPTTKRPRHVTEPAGTARAHTEAS